MVRKRRGIAGPNAKFVFDLMQFDKRLTRPYYTLYEKYFPVVFAVGQHQRSDLNTLAVRMMKFNRNN